MALLAPLEAQKDEDQRFVAFPDGRLLATDLNSYLFAEFMAFSKLADKCGDSRAQQYRDLAGELAQKVEETLWDETLGLYVNVDPLTGEKVLIRAWTGLTPALFGIAAPERTKRVIENNILNETHFLRPFGVASMADSELLSNQSPRGLYGRAIVCNWQGPVWILPNVFVVRKLMELGLVSEARNIASRVVRVMLKDIQENGMLHENYDANTGKCLWAPQFMSWNILALELVAVLEKRVSKRVVRRSLRRAA
jgi:putative isomerase